VYVAPQLLAHYVEAHNYLPPSEFVEAVEAFAADRRIAFEALRAQWRGRFPVLDGKWTHWRLFSHNCLVSVVSRGELIRALEHVEKLYRAKLSVAVSRSYSDLGGKGAVVEHTRHGISDVQDAIPRGFEHIFVLPVIEQLRSDIIPAARVATD
jgi:hypothetical protein